MRERHGFLIGFLIAVGIITFQDVRECHDIPFPPRIIATGLVFAMLDIFSFIQEELASIMAIGMVIGFGLNSFSAIQKAQAEGKVPKPAGMGFFGACCQDCRKCSGTAQPASFQALYPDASIAPPVAPPAPAPAQTPTREV